MELQKLQKDEGVLRDSWEEKLKTFVNSGASSCEREGNDGDADEDTTETLKNVQDTFKEMEADSLGDDEYMPMIQVTP